MGSLILQDTWHNGQFGDVVVWENPPELGHAFIKIRKQMAEQRIIERLDRLTAEGHVFAAIIGSPRRHLSNWRIL